jgi:hypothetical protein
MAHVEKKSKPKHLKNKNESFKFQTKKKHKQTLGYAYSIMNIFHIYVITVNKFGGGA